MSEIYHHRFVIQPHSDPFRDVLLYRHIANNELRLDSKDPFIVRLTEPYRIAFISHLMTGGFEYTHEEIASPEFRHEIVKCPSCGIHNDVRSGRANECNYCGAEITFPEKVGAL